MSCGFFFKRQILTEPGLVHRKAEMFRYLGLVLLVCVLCVELNLSKSVIFSIYCHGPPTQHKKDMKIVEIAIYSRRRKL